jgi:hypothetical protein
LTATATWTATNACSVVERKTARGLNDAVAVKVHDHVYDHVHVGRGL